MGHDPLLEKEFLDFVNYAPSGSRLPIVSIMGHINHGKTTLVDKLCNSSTVEVGGITQNISIKKLNNKQMNMLLIDTPGHNVFNNLRRAIMKVTDVLMLLVAADDACKEQTFEIAKTAADYSHLKIILCITKIDKGVHNLGKIYNELIKYNIISDQISGDILTTNISSTHSRGIDEFLELLHMQTMDLNLQTHRDRPAIGTIMDSVLQTGHGYVAKLLLQAGTIRVGDMFLCGEKVSKIKSIMVDNLSVKSASVDDIIDITGFVDRPHIGEKLYVINNNQKKFAALFKPEESIDTNHGELLFVLFCENSAQLETLNDALYSRGKALYMFIDNLKPSQVELLVNTNVICVLWGKFNNTIKILENHKINYVQSEVIYELLEKIDNFNKKPEEVITETGVAVVKKIFDYKNDRIAGCKVLSGKITLGSLCYIRRNNENIYVGKISSMKREKLAIEDSPANSECGLIIKEIERFVPGTFQENDEIITITKKYK